ncbi:chromate efflux transporter [Pigmentiphaga aceris]|uniref:Chromate efflux transporter n=1 Tax=Pigmentiphaga aceris TaxID=1940612 RepID=A0A5C0B236_9BURK|nr:chromate efflux transporter [Pigmentiphaga aceris]QEI06821.1 chromate efflux transporter [Pigmentiphaga aceris]
MTHPADSGAGSEPGSELNSNTGRLWPVFLIFLRLGLTSFGGPIAHLAYFRDEFVTRRRWISDRGYADLVALCQFLPGPASSQVGMALGLSRAGYSGALAAWAGFTLPSAIALIIFAVGLSQVGIAQTGMVGGPLHGLKIVAVAVVAQAIWGMARSLCVGALRASIMVMAACLVLFVPSAWSQVAAIVIAALVGLRWIVPTKPEASDAFAVPIGRKAGACWLALFFVLLIGLPVLVGLAPGNVITLIDAFYRAGALVFGGGHVVLPLLQAELVPTGLVSNDAFLAGYGATQAVPGPLFTFAAFLGASLTSQPTGWMGGVICLLAIFAPAFLLVAGALPFWASLRHKLHVQAMLSGINAAVVGLLLAAWYDPVWTSAIKQPTDLALALVALLALMSWKLAPWMVVAGSAALGGLLALVY